MVLYSIHITINSICILMRDWITDLSWDLNAQPSCFALCFETKDADVSRPPNHFFGSRKNLRFRNGTVLSSQIFRPSVNQGREAVCPDSRRRIKHGESVQGGQMVYFLLLRGSDRRINSFDITFERYKKDVSSLLARAFNSPGLQRETSIFKDLLPFSTARWLSSEAPSSRPLPWPRSPAQSPRSFPTNSQTTVNGSPAADGSSKSTNAPTRKPGRPASLKASRTTSSSTTKTEAS